jgi:hypothetical protein
MANFGKEDIGGSVTTINTDVGCPFAGFPANGTITSITWHNQGLNTDTSPRAALYLGDGTTDPNGDSLVQDFGQLTLSGNAWNSITGLSIAATAGADYWFWIKCNGTGPDWSRGASGDADLLGALRVTTGMNTDETVAFPANIPASGTLQGSRDASVYITYTVAASNGAGVDRGLINSGPNAGVNGGLVRRSMTKVNGIWQQSKELWRPRLVPVGLDLKGA